MKYVPHAASLIAVALASAALVVSLRSPPANIAAEEITVRRITLDDGFAKTTILPGSVRFEDDHGNLAVLGVAGPCALVALRHADGRDEILSTCREPVALPPAPPAP